MKYSSIFAFLILAISLVSVNPWSSLPIGNTILLFLLDFTLITFVVRLKFKFFKEDKVDVIVKLYLIWAIFGIIRGMFVAENYWEWKQWYGQSIALVLPIFVFVFSNKFILQKTLRVWIKYALPLFLFFAFFVHPTAYGFYFPPILIFGIFFPGLTKLWKIIIVLLLIFVISIDFTGARSTVLKNTIVLLIIIGYYFKDLLGPVFLRTSFKMIIVIPITLLYLGLTGTFNIFDMRSYVKNENVDRDLLSDTRSFIYYEQIESALKNNYVIWGRTPARGFDSIFGLKNNELIRLAGNTKGIQLKPERGGCEVLFLNIFNYLGLIGVLLYSFIYFKAAFLALYKSKNMYIKMMALYVVFRWAYGWVEDANRFDIGSISLWIMISICLSEQFRNMNNLEFTIWVRGIFNFNYNYPRRIVKGLETNK